MPKLWPTLKLAATLLFLVLSVAARADVADAYALQVDGDHVRFTIAVNGIPVGVAGGRKLAGAAFFLDSLLRAGDNDVVVGTVLDAAYGTVQLTLTAPASSGQNTGVRLGHVQCGFAQPDGKTPPCRAADSFHLAIHLAKAPDFALWHAQRAPASAPVSADAIAAALAGEQAALAASARAQDWAALFLGRDPRRADLLAAGPGVRAQAGEMAGHMREAARAHPGVVRAAPAPAPAELVLTALTANLVAASRRDGAPVLRVQVGAAAGQDPEDFGDYGDRYLDGIYQQSVAIFGNYAGTWRRVR